MSNQKTTIRKVLRYVRPYYAALIASLSLALLFVAMSLYIPILVGHAIACIVDKGLVDFVAVSRKLLQIGICVLIAALAQWIMS